MHLLDGIMEGLAGVTHTNMYACWHTNMHVCWQINMHVSLNTSVQICTYAGGFFFLCITIHQHTNICMCASIQICTYAGVLIYIHAADRDIFARADRDRL